MSLEFHSTSESRRGACLLGFKSLEVYDSSFLVNLREFDYLSACTFCWPDMSNMGSTVQIGLKRSLPLYQGHLIVWRDSLIRSDEVPSYDWRTICNRGVYYRLRRRSAWYIGNSNKYFLWSTLLLWGCIVGFILFTKLYIKSGSSYTSKCTSVASWMRSTKHFSVSGYEWPFSRLFWVPLPYNIASKANKPQLIRSGCRLCSRSSEQSDGIQSRFLWNKPPCPILDEMNQGYQCSSFVKARVFIGILESTEEVDQLDRSCTAEGLVLGEGGLYTPI